MGSLVGEALAGAGIRFCRMWIFRKECSFALFYLRKYNVALSIIDISM